jgi:ferredoxin
MIISSPKPLHEIKKAIQPYQKLAIFGCGGCAAVCQSGGTKQVEELAHDLDDKQVIFTFQIDEPCDQRILTRELNRIAKRLDQIDAVIILACGIGVQMLAALLEKPCFTGLDTLFPGAVIHSNKFFETCNACGECILNETAAICPRTLCPKGIAFGPCSEKLDEQCSVDKDAECVWVRIDRRREHLKLTAPDSEFTPLDWAARGAPRQIPKRRCRY